MNLERVITRTTACFYKRGNKRRLASGVLLTRHLVFEYIAKHPGSYLRQIKRELALPKGVIQYQLYSLEKERKILGHRRGFYKRFYPNFVFNEKEQLILDILSHETQRDLLLFLIENPKANQKRLAEFA